MLIVASLASEDCIAAADEAVGALDWIQDGGIADEDAAVVAADAVL